MPFREFHFNADFDQSLRAVSGTGATAVGSPAADASPERAFVLEMAMHFLFAGDPGDSLILHRALPADFLGYLDEKGFSVPTQVIEPAFTPETEFTPFGWNEAAARRNLRYRRPADHPALEAVRRANSRAYGRELETAWDGDDGGGRFESWNELEACLKRPAPHGWVVKANHGHAGTANLRLFGAAPGVDERKLIDAMFAENGCVVAEPWHERVRDLAVNFRVEKSGEVRDLRGHELSNSRDGAFLGVKVAPDHRAPEPWRAPLEERARRLGAALAAIGYFGPVGMDSYVWRDAAGTTRLRPMVDINARFSMALPAHGLARRLPGKWILWEWFKPKKLTIPESYAELKAAMGDADFDHARGEGILAASPLRVDIGRGVFRKPRRIGFLFAAATEEKLAALRAGFVLKGKA